MPVLELNEFLGEYLNREFMQDFIADARRALEYSADVSYRNMEEAVRALREGLPVFQKEKLDRSACVRMQKSLAEKVKASIDPLAIVKDSLSYTFAFQFGE